VKLGARQICRSALVARPVMGHSSGRATKRASRQGVHVSGSPESVVREFLGAWTRADADELRRFLTDDAVWVDGPQGVRRGANAFVGELAKQLAISRGMDIEVRTLVAEGSTVMVEWNGNWRMGNTPIYATVMAVFTVDGDGRINQMREAYDLQSVIRQIEAAGFDVSS
jgi:limonene-1,2-epoxide hydrolase